jgi:Ca2+-binding RTX toxin-like protein
VGQQVRVVASYTDGHGTLESKASSATVAVANVNDTPTGGVAIAGTTTQNQTLTASHTLGDLDGLGAIGYQWQSSDDGTSWSNVAGATSANFTLTEAQVGQQVRVVAGYTDGHGTAESVVSVPTAIVANVNDVLTGNVAIAGSAMQNQTLTASNTLGDIDGLGTVGYQWQSSANGTNWSNVTGATSADFTLTEAQVGQQVRVVASYTDGHGTLESKASGATVAVANVNDAPTGGVAIAGTATQNQTLTASHTLGDLDGLGAIGYQWQSSADGTNWSNVAGATSASFTLSEAQVGRQVRVVAGYTDGHGTAESIVSAATPAIANANDAPTGNVAVAGSAMQNQTLTASHTLGDLDGLGAIDYQWQSSADGTNWSDVAGATNANFTLTEAQVGQQVRVVASYTDGYGTLESKASSATAVVANVNDAAAGAVTVAGSATQGQTLTASNTLGDLDGLGTIGYQWQSSVDGTNWSNVAGATSADFTLTEAQVGKQVRAVASYTDGHGTHERVSSVATSLVLNVNDAPTGGVTVVGAATQNQELFADIATLNDADALGFVGYQWQVSDDGATWSDIADATASSFALSQSQVGKQVRVVANYADGHGTAESVVSGATTIVADVNDAPVAETIADQAATQDIAFNFVVPANGFSDVDIGDTLTYSVSLADGDPLPTWLKFDVATRTFSGKPSCEDTGNFSVKVTATDSAGASVSQAFALAVRLRTGTAGSDYLTGTSGADTLTGFAGNDNYIVNNTGDVIVENANEGYDRIDASISYVLPDNIEVLILAGYGSIDGTGNAQDNLIWGNIGNNVLDGGAGNDYLKDDGGSDTYIFGRGYGTDSINDYARLAGEVDTVQMLAGILPTDVSVTAESGGQGLVLRIIGTNDQLTLTNWFSDRYTIEQVKFADGTVWDKTMLLAKSQLATAGADCLKGTAGADTLIGLAGNDIYIVNDPGDIVIENANEGIDTVQSSLSYTLSANVEQLYLMGDAAIDGTGNELGNWLSGNDAANTLDGKAGNDYLLGGKGGDTYLFGRGYGQEIVYDYGLVGEIDSVQMQADVLAEDVTVRADTSGGLIVSINGTGDQITVKNWNSEACAVEQIKFGDGTVWDKATLLVKSQTGTAGADYLRGTAGADTLTGLAGNDTYLANDSGDVVVENANEGNDTVNSSVSYALSANVENLTLTGNAAIDGTGNALDNIVIGNGAANILDGGAGSDCLVGGTGSDTYVFGRGYGQDSLCEYSTVAGEVDTVKMLANVLPGDVVVRSDSYGNLSLSISGTYDRLSILSWFDDGYAVEQVEFADGTVWDKATLLAKSQVATAAGDYQVGSQGADTMAGLGGSDTYVVNNVGDEVVENPNEGANDTIKSSVSYTLAANVEMLFLTGDASIDGSGNAQNNQIYGNCADNVLDGGAGNDTLYGFGGNDTYIFGTSGGHDTVFDSDGTAGNTDRLQFGSGIASDQLWFRHVGNDLEVDVIGTADFVTIKDWYASASYNHIEQFKTADGSLLLDKQVEALVQAMAAFTPPSVGETTLPPEYQSSLAPVIAANWH